MEIEHRSMVDGSASSQNAVTDAILAHLDGRVCRRDLIRGDVNGTATCVTHNEVLSRLVEPVAGRGRVHCAEVDGSLGLCHEADRVASVRRDELSGNARLPKQLLLSQLPAVWHRDDV